MTHLKSAKLRDVGAMFECLLKVSDISHLRERFYPLLAALAGRQLNGPGVIVAIQLAIADYAQGLPPIISDIMYMQTDDFVRAIMPDEEVVRDAIQFNAEAQASFRSVAG